MSMLHIRPATKADEGTISALILSVAYLFFATPDGKGAEKFIQTSTPPDLFAFMSRPDMNYLLGEVNGAFCGVVAVRDHRHLQHLFIAPAFQRQGIGKTLWLHARKMAVDAGSVDNFTVNASLHAVPFYQRLGFRVVGDALVGGGLKYQPMEQSNLRSSVL